MVRFAFLGFYPLKERDLAKIRIFLRDELGLVPPTSDSDERGTTHKDKLVWEDKTKVGRYSVDFLENPPRILFRYFGRRITQGIEKSDPMYAAILKVVDRLPSDTRFSGYDTNGRDVNKLR